jgi:hypothetical protein
MDISISFRSLDARRLSTTKGQVNINNNSTITSITKSENKMEVSFIFSCNYDPNIGVIRIEGDLTVEDTDENIENAIKEWYSSEHKKLPKDTAEKVHNAILSNCIVEASILARDVKLPAPIPMPQVTMDKELDTSYIR